LWVLSAAGHPAGQLSGPKINFKIVSVFSATTNDMLLTSFATHSTTTSPRFHHSKNTKIAKTLSKNHIPPRQNFSCKKRRIEIWESAGSKLSNVLQVTI
jgi:hypothetical protein